MKPFRPIVVFYIAVLICGMALDAQSPSIIEPKVERHEGPPFWISAEEVADAQKVIDLEKIDSISLRLNVEKQWRELGGSWPDKKSNQAEKPSVVPIPISECRRTQSVTDERGGSGSSATLAALASNSKSILHGKIRTVDLGFDSGVPGSLLGIEILDVIKGSAPKPIFYILYPVARFKIGPLHFCNATKGFEPRKGDEILLFDFTGPDDRDEILFAPRMDQILFQSQSGTLFLPAQLKNGPELKAAQSLADVIARLVSVRALNPKAGVR